MAYSYRIFDSIEQVDLTGWQRVRASFQCIDIHGSTLHRSGGGRHGAVEKYWYIVIDDEGGAPVACTSASAMTLTLRTSPIRVLRASFGTLHGYRRGCGV